MWLFTEKVSLWQSYTSMAAIAVGIWMHSGWSALICLSILVAGAVVEGVVESRDEA